MKKIFTIFAIMMMFFFSNAQIPSIQWQNTFGGESDEEAKSIIQTKDGGYIVCGYTDSEGAGKADIWLLKLDKSGELDWDNTYGGAKDDIGNSIIATRDGGFALAGSTESFGKGSSDFWVIKTDFQGKALWKKPYGGPQAEEAYDIIQCLDGDFVVCGYTKSRGAGSSDLWVIKTNGGDKEIWRKNYGGGRKDDANNIIQKSDSSFILIGSTMSYGAGGSDAWFMKLVDKGRAKVKLNFGGAEYEYANSITETKDGGYIFCGASMSNSKGLFDAWVVKLNSMFEKEWESTYGDSKEDKARVIINTKDGGYVIAGNTQSKGNGSYDCWLIKLNKNGKFLWDKTIGGKKDDRVYDMIETLDGGIIVCGYTKSEGSGKKDLWVVKLK